MCTYSRPVRLYYISEKNSILYIVTIFWQCSKIEKKCNSIYWSCILFFNGIGMVRVWFSIVTKFIVLIYLIIFAKIVKLFFPFLSLGGVGRLFTRQMIAMMRRYRFFILMVWCADSMIYDNAVIGKSKILLCRSLKFCA